MNTRTIFHNVPKVSTFADAAVGDTFVMAHSPTNGVYRRVAIVGITTAVNVATLEKHTFLMTKTIIFVKVEIVVDFNLEK